VFLAGCCVGSSPGAPLTGVALGPTSPNFGFTVCTTRALHDCRGTATTRMGVRAYPLLDFDPVPCVTQEADALAACGPPRDPATLRCYASHGVLYDSMVVGPGTSAPDVPNGRFTLQCSEGQASIDFIEPL
jgi:hypothetical protein